ncbi:MAG: DNA polymerase III subunit delta [Clostridia bacterium]|nr:DNA polymerase III subunit delta [Clostridia bacterium]
MTVNNEDFLSNQLASKKPLKVYVLFGDDSYLLQYYYQKICSLGCTGDPFFNLQKFEGDCDLQDVYDAVNQFPMMADSKCVVLSDFNFPKCETADFEKLLKIVSEVEEGCVLVLKFECVPIDTRKDSRVKKLFELAEKMGGCVVEFRHRTKQKLARMLITGAKKRGITLTERDAFYIVETSGEDLGILKNELEKLCGYCKEGTVTREDIDKVCVKSIDANIYEYVDDIVDGKLSAALSILDKMFFMRIDPFIILYSISSCYVDMFRVLCAKKVQKTNEEIVADFAYKNKGFLVNKARRNLKNFDAKKLNESFECLIKADKTLKSFGADPRQLLEQLTVKLTDILWR